MAGMDRIAATIMEIQVVIADHFTPALRRAAWALLEFGHGVHVGWYVSAPWWRRVIHLLAVGAHLDNHHKVNYP